MPNYLTQSEIRPMQATLERFSIPVPKRLAEADRVAALAQAACMRVLQEIEPAIVGLTVKNLAARIDQLATWTAMSAHRQAAATAVQSQAEKEQRDIWTEAIDELHQLLAPKFADAADRLLAALEELGGELAIDVNVAHGRGDAHRAGTEAAADLEALRTASSILHGRLPVSDTPFWKWSRIVALPTYATAAWLDSIARRGATPLHDAAEGDLRWWANLAREPGVRLQWHTPAEQEAMRVHLMSLPTERSV